MNMLSLTRDELNKYDALTPKLNQHIANITDAIPFNISPHMKAVIAVTQITTFAAQFRRNVELYDGTEVPINAISFIVSGSGKNKDSSVRAASRCFQPGYDIIQSHNHKALVDEAIQAASEAGDEPPDAEGIYKPYMKPEIDIETMVTTGPGLIDHINAVTDMPFGASLVSSSEFADELAYNPDMVENIKILAETYDLGKKQSKHTKGAEFRSRSINGASVNALFIGSPTFLLYDEPTKKKFNIAFMSKLARRSWFCYAPEKLPEPEFDSIEDFFKYEDDLELTAKQARSNMSDFVQSVAEFGIKTKGHSLPVTKEVERLFKTYKRYNNDLAESSPNSESTAALIRRHLQWKAIKLAGAFAILDQSNSVEAHHYVDAIRFCEMLDQDMSRFEQHLNKADHERFSDYIRTLVDASGKASISLHDLKKMGFIKSTSSHKLLELVQLAAGYDLNGIYNLTPDGGGIQYEPIITTDTISVSYKPIDCSQLNTAVRSGDIHAIRAAKDSISLTVAYGFETESTQFAELGQLLSGDFAYSPFYFRDGIRGRDNIVGGTKWLTLDIDDSPLSAEETHFMLSEFNHYIALSSDPDNHYKFRVLIELDTVVELSSIAWKHFYLAIANDLALNVDPLPQSQIFFSYADRLVLSNLDASPLVTRDYVILARDREAEKAQSQRQLTSAQAKAQLDDPETTFSYAFHCKSNGSLNMYRMMQHAKLLGASLDQTIQLIHDVNEFWSMDLGAMPQDRIDRLIEQAQRLF
jgi:hypothetical protein